MLKEVREITGEVEAMAGSSHSDVGTGGMITKILAAQIATEAGIDMLIANAAEPDILERVFDGEALGTYFYGKPKDRA